MLAEWFDKQKTKIENVEESRTTPMGTCCIDRYQVEGGWIYFTYIIEEVGIGNTQINTKERYSCLTSCFVPDKKFP